MVGGQEGIAGGDFASGLAAAGKEQFLEGEVSFVGGVVEEEVVAVVVGVAAEDVLDVEHFEGDAGSCDYDGQQVVNLGLLVLYAARFLALPLAVLLARYETEFGGDGEVAEGHEEDLFEEGLGSVVFEVPLLEVLVSEGDDLHGVANRVVFELLLQNVVPVGSLLAVLRLLPHP